MLRYGHEQTTDRPPMLNPRGPITGLVLVLAVQLTGFTCLDEWTGGSWHASTVSYQQSAPASEASPAAEDDGCPCHLAFVHNPSGAPAVSVPTATLDASLRPASALQHPFIPFHPPLTF